MTPLIDEGSPTVTGSVFDVDRRVVANGAAAVGEAPDQIDVFAGSHLGVEPADLGDGIDPGDQCRRRHVGNRVLGGDRCPIVTQIEG